MIELPEGIVPNMVQPSLVDQGGYQGNTVLTRVDRLGNRYSVVVGLPPILNRDLGRVVVSRLLKAKTQGMRIEWQLVGIDQGSPGSPRIKGADQAGDEILIDGCRPGYGVSEGFWLSIETDGQHYLYNVAEPATADGAGEMAIKLTPALRKPPADNDVIHLQKPMIEGAVLGDRAAWDYSLAHHVGIEFEIMEAR